MARLGVNGFKCLEIAEKGYKWLKIANEWPAMAGNVWKLLYNYRNYWICLEMIGNDYKLIKID